MENNLFIPKRIKVGFQKREGTFTGKLAYVIYYDEKGKIRKEKSWLGWCDSKIPSVEFDNIPTSGFVFNKGVQRYGHWHSSGRSMVRIYDSRDFEFEITIDNVIGLLMHSDVSKRDIVQECVYAWHGTELILLPTNSEEYKNSIEYTKKQTKKISTKELKTGHVYSQKKTEKNLTYVGYYIYYDCSYPLNQKCKGKRHVFYEEKQKEFVIPSVDTLAEEILAEPVANYASLVDKFFASKHAKRIVDIKLSTINKKTDVWYKEIGKGQYYYFRHSSYNKSLKYLQLYGVEFKFTESGFDKEYLSLKFKPSDTFGLWNSSRDRKQPIDMSTQYYLLEQYFKTNNISLEKIEHDDLDAACKYLGYSNTISFVTEEGNEIKFDL